MAILRERVVWQRPRPPRRAPLGLTTEEQRHVRQALRVLKVRYRGWLKLAQALGIPLKSLERYIQGKDRPIAPGLAIGVARLASVPVDDVLKGLFPRPGECPMCGHRKVYAGETTPGLGGDYAIRARDEDAASLRRRNR